MNKFTKKKSKFLKLAEQFKVERARENPKRIGHHIYISGKF